MINNRQGNRRRGRNNNNPRQNNNRGGGDSANRIDSRARGNAAQLLEKYKNMARDAQTQGDRVLTEYYLQFADHYFRVLADVRARQEEQQAERRARHEERSQNWREDNEGMDIEGVEHGVEGEPMLDDMRAGAESGEGDEAGEDRPRAARSRRDTRNDREPRNDRGDRPERVQRSDRSEQADRSEQSGRSERSERGNRNERPSRSRNDANGYNGGRARDEDEPLGLDASLLPPAIGVVSEEVVAPDVEVEAPKPRRGRKPKAESAEAAD